jgi:hypothetical protein
MRRLVLSGVAKLARSLHLPPDQSLAMPWEAFQKAVELVAYDDELEDRRLERSFGRGFGGDSDANNARRDEWVRAIEQGLGF